ILAGTRKRDEAPWLRTNCLRQALVVLALGAGRQNFFRLPGTTAPPEVAAVPTARQSRSISQRVGGWFRGMAIRAFSQMRALPEQSAVHIARASDYGDDLAGILHSQYEHFRATVPLHGKRVVLKPNLVEFHRDKVINTNPLVVA